MPRLGDPNFGESVTYICQHDAAGALGIVINKPSGVTLAEICSRMDIDVSPGADASLPVLSGGPVEPARGFVLHDASQEYEGTVPIDEDIRLTVSRNVCSSRSATPGGGKGSSRPSSRQIHGSACGLRRKSCSRLHSRTAGWRLPSSSASTFTASVIIRDAPSVSRGIGCRAR
jgi:hypothetical protein